MSSLVAQRSVVVRQTNGCVTPALISGTGRPQSVERATTRQSGTIASVCLTFPERVSDERNVATLSDQRIDDDKKG